MSEDHIRAQRAVTPKCFAVESTHYGEYRYKRMTNSSTKPTRSRFVRLVFAGVLSLALLGGLGLRNREPVYAGKTLTDWLYDKDYTSWMPNDVYGHIHNEFWEALLAGGYSAGQAETNCVYKNGDQPIDMGLLATQRLGTNAIPRLLELLSSQPWLSERCRAQITRVFPVVGPFLYRFACVQDAEGLRIAAWKGFNALGTNAESALPTLEKMLHRPQADFLLGSTIAEIGPKGIDVLVAALTNEDNNITDVAAFALGEAGAGARTSAVPVLVKLVEQGRGRYQVLGALGMLGGYPGLVIPALSARLSKTSEVPQAGFSREMAILVLGLYGEQSRSAVPALVQLYADSDKTSRQVIRVVLKHVEPKHAQELLGRPPNARDDEDPWWNGAVD